MDPNRTLDELRKQAENSGETWSYMFEALDGWIIKGGFLPDDWDRTKVTQLLRSARYNVTQIDADLASMRNEPREPFSSDEMYHQGYQNGRKAELESLIATLGMLVGQ